MTNRSAGDVRDPHAGHDLESIAAYAAGDANANERARAETVIRTCDTCARLVDDLRAIAAATRQLPAPTPIAHDYRLSDEDAARLRGGLLRRAARALGLSAWNPRPLAAALTTLGVAGLLIAVVPFLSFGSAGGAASASMGGTTDQKAVFGADSGAGAPSAAASVVLTGGVPAAVESSARSSAAVRDSLVPEDLAFTSVPTTAATSAPTVAAPAPEPAAARQETPGSPLVFLSLGLIAAGGLLFSLGRGTRGSR